jgi:hypothetical protein
MMEQRLFVVARRIEHANFSDSDLSAARLEVALASPKMKP